MGYVMSQYGTLQIGYGRSYPPAVEVTVLSAHLPAPDRTVVFPPKSAVEGPVAVHNPVADWTYRGFVGAERLGSGYLI